MSKQRPAVLWLFSRCLGLTLCRILLLLRAVLLFSMLLLQASTFTIGILVMAHTTITPTVAVVSRLIPILVLGHILSCCLVTMILVILVFTLMCGMSCRVVLVLFLSILFILLLMLLGIVSVS